MTNSESSIQRKSNSFKLMSKNSSIEFRITRNKNENKHEIIHCIYPCTLKKSNIYIKNCFSKMYPFLIPPFSIQSLTCLKHF